MSFRAQVFSKTFAGAGTTRFPGGRFFRLITAAADVTLVFYSPSGEELATIAGVRAGLGIKAENLTGDKLSTFGSVDVTSATAQAVAALISSVEADYDRSAGTVDISGGTIDTVTTVGTVAAITPPTSKTTSFRRESASAALDTIVTPAANTAGIYISYACVGNVTDSMRLMIKTSAPATWADGAAIVVAPKNGTSAKVSNQIRGVIVPAGYGLYAQADAAGGSTSVEVTYALL